MSKLRDILRLCATAGSLAALGALAGCNFLPASGPYTSEIQNNRKDTDGFNYKLVPMGAEAVRVLSFQEREGLIGTFRGDQRPPPRVKVGMGDEVAVSIFEASSGGLFIPAEAASRAGNFVDIPRQTVDNNGNISVPYAGLIKAVGREPAQIEAEIVERLRNRAIEPQAVVSVTQQRSSWVTVIGETSGSIKFPLRSTGERVLDAVGQAGSLANKGYDTFLTLQRNGREGTISFNRLIREPANNVYLQPGDTIYIYARARKFLAFGASGAQGEFAFGDDTVTLSQALAKAGGLSDGQADPQSVFMFRMEARSTLERMGVDVSDVPPGAGRVPTIYTVNLGDPTGFLLASKVYMRDKDIIYISNAGAVDLAKFLQIVLLAATTAREIGDAQNVLVP
ncbi:polysaccharide biosynthesis/export family protein [Xanthobacter tagetidis]|uniref:Polysaccharide export protein n=1 Tax=Xanthobacter tagetidis TaxID=60216 RepID=A0A3L7A1V9_9HYPH|nr:polysaccharide biosynthesis/export family protein [Xanthobacter tagetidis]MBB6309448.1 polysaccharide export outer membrane protein [Xanthobacter tagetidis]RLP73561.1 polysaccharide export protein [Xanthobacter tagetidis]